MSKEKTNIKKSVSRSTAMERPIKAPAKAGNIQSHLVDKAVKKVAGQRTGVA